MTVSKQVELCQMSNLSTNHHIEKQHRCATVIVVSVSGKSTASLNLNSAPFVLKINTLPRSASSQCILHVKTHAESVFFLTHTFHSPMDVAHSKI